MNYKYVVDTFGKLLVIKQSKGCKSMSKMHQNTFGGQALLMGCPRPPSRSGGATSKGDGREGRREGAEREFPLKVKVNRINTALRVTSAS